MTSSIKWLPGCACCECEIYAANFATNVISDFTVTGTGVVSSGALELTGAGTTAILDTLHPQYPHPPRVLSKIKGGANSELRLFLSWSANHNIAVELRPGTACGELDIYQTVSGVESLLSGTHDVPGLTIDEWHRVYFCYDPRDDAVVVKVVASDGRITVVSATAGTHTHGEQSGMGTGATHSGTAYFDDFRFARLWIYGDGEQDDWDVDYQSGSEPYIECSKCDAGTICEWVNADFADSDNTCEWEGDIGDWAIDEPTEVIETLVASSIVIHKNIYPNDYADTINADGYVIEDNYHRHLLLMAVQVDDAGRTVQAIVASDDTTDNYCAVEVTFGTGTDNECGEVVITDTASGDISETHVVRGLVNGATVWWIRVDFNDGVIRCSISNESTQVQAADIPNDGSHWAREFQSDYDATATYHGGQVGVGVSGGTGDVAVSYFKAGCDASVQYCIVEHDEFAYALADWAECQWNLESGTLPTRTLSGSTYTLDAAAAYNLKHLNPLSGDAVNGHVCVVQFTRTELIAVGDKWGCWAGGTDSTDAYIFTAECTAKVDSDCTIKFIIERGASSDTDYAYNVSDANDGVFGLKICVSSTGAIGELSVAGGTVRTAISSQDLPAGGYCGVFADPTISISLASFYLYRQFLTTPTGTVTPCAGCAKECVWCLDGALPDEWLVDLDGLESYNSDCSLINRAYFVSSPVGLDYICIITTWFTIEGLGNYDPSCMGSTPYTCCDCYVGGWDNGPFDQNYGAPVGFYVSEGSPGPPVIPQVHDAVVAVSVYIANGGVGGLEVCPGWTIPALTFAVVVRLSYTICGPYVFYPHVQPTASIYYGKEYSTPEWYGILPCTEFSELELEYKGTGRGSVLHTTSYPGLECEHEDYGWEFGKSGGYDDGTTFYPDSDSTVKLTAI